MSATIDTWTGRIGFLAGLSTIAASLATFGTPGTAAEPAASIRLGALANGELELSPLGKPVLASDALRAGGRPVTGTLRVRNQTPRALSFSVRTTAVQRELDRAAWIEFSDGTRIVLRTPLSQTRKWSRDRIRLASGDTRTLRVRVWIPAEAPDGWQAARGDLTLEFASRDREVR